MDGAAADEESGAGGDSAGPRTGRRRSFFGGPYIATAASVEQGGSRHGVEFVRLAMGDYIAALSDQRREFARSTVKFLKRAVYFADWSQARCAAAVAAVAAAAAAHVPYLGPSCDRALLHVTTTDSLCWPACWSSATCQPASMSFSRLGQLCSPTPAQSCMQPVLTRVVVWLRGIAWTACASCAQVRHRLCATCRAPARSAGLSAQRSGMK